MNLRTCLMLSLLGAASMNALACYTVYNEQDRVVYQGLVQPPIDMSRPLHEVLPSGWHMVFDEQGECRAVDLAQYARPAGPPVPPNTALMPNRPPVQARTSPLLTQRRIAEAQKLPYRVLSGEIVVVPAPASPPVSTPDIKEPPRFVPTGLQAAAPHSNADELVATEADAPQTAAVHDPSAELDR